MLPRAKQHHNRDTGTQRVSAGAPRASSLCAKTVKCTVSCRDGVTVAVKDGCVVWTLGPGWKGGAGRGRGKRRQRDGTLRFGCGVGFHFFNPHLMDERWRESVRGEDSSCKGSLGASNSSSIRLSHSSL